MKYDIYFYFKFNNYYNRKIIFYDSLDDYELNSEAYGIIEDVNFNPNDGLNAHLIVNTNKLTGRGEFDNIPDYLVITEHESTEIMARWFILSVNRTTGNQYDFTIRRDVISDHFETLKNCPIYVNKGYLKESDPLIFNDEGLTFNQIKVSDELINDTYHDTAWVIGYMDNSASANDITGTPVDAPANYKTLAQIATIIGGNMTEQDLIDAINGSIEFNADNKFKIFYSKRAELQTAVFAENIANGDLAFNEIYYNPASYWGQYPVGDKLPMSVGWGDIVTNNQTWLNNNTNIILNAILNHHGVKYHTTSELNDLGLILRDENNNIILYGGRYYHLRMVAQGTSQIKFDFNSKIGEFAQMTQDAGWTTIYDNGLYYIEFQAMTFTLQLEEIATTAIKTNISSTHNTLRDAPFSAFAIPFNTKQPFYYGGHYFDHITGDSVLDIVNAIAKALTTSKLYDLQLVPYCPIDWGIDNWDLSPTGGDYRVENVDYNLIKDSEDNPVGVIYYLKQSNFKTTISKQLHIKDNLKVDSNCRFYRLCSPNYNGVFDFNLAKNGGSISAFYVEGTLKPYNPYFRITPDFNMLYGANYNDGRGLICGGDFSLPIMSSAWENYQVQNKNFRSIFAREIQNLSVSQKQEAFLQNLQAGAGVVTGGTAGAIAGAQFGGVYGAIGGAVIGTGAGLVGGAIDIAMGNERRKEQRDYMIDRFNYSLMNIKALPESLAKNSAFTINNKLQPFIELYEPTPEEIEAFKNKIEFDGMTVNRIGYLVEFYDPENMHYFKGQLIRWNYENVSKRIDSSVVNAIGEELLKGVYI